MTVSSIKLQDKFLKRSTLQFYISMGLISITYLFILFTNRGRLDLSFNYDELSKKYQDSQIVRGSEATTTMLDPELYQYAGYTYVTQGKLDEVNIEHPPLAKYLYGISSIFLKSPLILQLVLGFLVLLCLFLLNTRYISNPLLACVPSLLLCSDKLFIDQVTQTELDLPLAFLILVFLLYNASADRPGKVSLVIHGVLLGLIASVKFPSAALILMLVYAIQLARTYSRTALRYTFSFLACSLLVYLMLYLPLISTKGINSFVSAQITAVRIHRSHLPQYPKGAPLKVIFQNQWPVWFDKTSNTQAVGVWSILWPISTVMFVLLFILWKKLPNKLKMSVLFAFLYFIFINSRLFFPRYLMVLLPFFYTSMVSLPTLTLASRLKKAS